MVARECSCVFDITVVNITLMVWCVVSGVLFRNMLFRFKIASWRAVVEIGKTWGGDWGDNKEAK